MAPLRRDEYRTSAVRLAGSCGSRRDRLLPLPLMSSVLPETLLQFIRSAVPTYQAAEVLLFFAAHPDRDFSPEEIVVAMRPVVITVPAVREYTRLFAARQLILEKEGAYRYGPSDELEPRIGELAHAYNEKPVTLIRAIYQIADDPLRSFADAFDLSRDET